MRVLVLSVSAGGGHGHAADAIKDYISLNIPEAEVTIVDTLKYINPLIDKVVIGSYLRTLKVTPSLYGKLYTYSEGDYRLATTISSKFIEIMAHKLLPLLEDFKPDILICTHPFSTEMVSIMKFKYNFNTPAMSIITDYYSHSSWLHSNINAYIVSNHDMIEDMVSKGIPRKIIYNLGIPVKPKFLKQYNKLNTLKELNLYENKSTILVMGGSLGMGKIANIYKELNKIKNDFQIVVITGNNRKLYGELLKLKNDSTKETRIIGFTSKVNKYMQCSDLLLTKPGGLTISEALICNVPLGIFSPIPGQEEKNAEFLLKNKLAVDLSSIDNCNQVIENLLVSKEKLDIMRQNCLKFSKPNAGNNIVKLMSSLLKAEDVLKDTISTEEPLLKEDSDKTVLKSMERYFTKAMTRSEDNSDEFFI
jgi:processive 1,2-diacylglycerol beta-glucosyltransferase